MNKIKVGVAGVGSLGRHHTRLYQDSKISDLVGIYDTNTEQSQKIADEFQTTVYTSLDALAEDVDCFSVAVPTHLHFQTVSGLLKMGKHILVEKPLTSTVSEAKELVKFAENHGRVLHVGHVERYNPVINYLQKKVNDPRFIESHRLAPYPPPRSGLLPRGTEESVVLDLMIHDIDIILNLVDSSVTAIDAVGVPILSDSEDIANVRINFKNGCVANLTASRVSHEYMRKIRIFQSDAYLSLDYQEKKGELVYKDKQSIKREDVPIEDHNALEKELEFFITTCRYVIDNGSVPDENISARHALDALEIGDRIVSQINEKKN